MRGGRGVVVGEGEMMTREERVAVGEGEMMMTREERVVVGDEERRKAGEAGGLVSERGMMILMTAMMRIGNVGGGGTTTRSRGIERKGGHVHGDERDGYG